MEKKETKKDNPVDELIGQVVGILKPQMDIGIQAKFDELKNSIVNELRDLRNQVPQVEYQQPLQQPLVQPQPQPQQMDLMSMIFPLVQALIKPQENNNMSNLLAEAMMRKMLSDTSRSEILNQAVMNHLFKQVFHDENLLADYNKTAESFMSPITKFGSIKDKPDKSEKT